ncbi:MAG: response regulator, partial [Gallionellaceae bacterium]|nr:response regulator [Gallionellaceae bacterium]
MARIIIVEDDPGQKEELQSFLTHTGHEVLAFGDGMTLDRALTHFTPDIALLDFNLPGESGTVLAGRLRERFGQNIGLVMITARSMTSDRVESRLAGVD